MVGFGSKNIRPLFVAAQRTKLIKPLALFCAGEWPLGEFKCREGLVSSCCLIWTGILLGTT